MPPKLIIACVAAFALIAVAAFVRFTGYTGNIKNGLAYINNENLAGPSDSAQDAVDTSASSSDLNVPVANQNQTDVMSQKLFASLMVLQQGGNLTDQSVLDLANNLASSVDASTTAQYQLSDLTIMSSSTPAQLKDYANQFWTIREKYANLYQQNPVGSADFAADPSDPSFASGFVETGDLYIQMAADLSQIPVPAQLATLHLDLLNNYAASGEELKKVGQINSDSVSAMSGLNTFEEYSDYETTTLEIMAQYFSDSGIIFTSQDPGIGWNTI